MDERSKEKISVTLGAIAIVCATITLFAGLELIGKYIENGTLEAIYLSISNAYTPLEWNWIYLVASTGILVLCWIVNKYAL